MIGHRSLPVAAVIAVCSLGLSGCSIHNLNFEADERVEITTPGDGDDVVLPFDVAWDYSDIDVAEAPGRDGIVFAVFAGRVPVRPGQRIDTVLDDDCWFDDGCDPTSELAEYGVYLATDDRVRVDRVAGSDDEFSVAIVLIGSDGRRIGESVFRVDVSAEDGDSP